MQYFITSIWDYAGGGGNAKAGSGVPCLHPHVFVARTGERVPTMNSRYFVLVLRERLYPLESNKSAEPIMNLRGFPNPCLGTRNSINPRSQLSKAQRRPRLIPVKTRQSRGAHNNCPVPDQNRYCEPATRTFFGRFVAG